MVEAGLHHAGGKTVRCAQDPEMHAYAVISGMLHCWLLAKLHFCAECRQCWCTYAGGPNNKQKDMGDLLQEHGRDMLMFHAGDSPRQPLAAMTACKSDSPSPAHATSRVSLI